MRRMTPPFARTRSFGRDCDHVYRRLRGGAHRYAALCFEHFRDGSHRPQLRGGYDDHAALTSPSFQ